MKLLDLTLIKEIYEKGIKFGSTFKKLKYYGKTYFVRTHSENIWTSLLVEIVNQGYEVNMGNTDCGYSIEINDSLFKRSLIEETSK